MMEGTAADDVIIINMNASKLSKTYGEYAKIEFIKVIGPNYW